MSSGYGCHIDLDTIENYLILRAVVLTYIYGISFTTLLGWKLLLPGGCLDFPCCDPVRGEFLGGGGSPPWHLGPQCPILSHLEHLKSLAWQLFCQLDAVMCNYGSPWRVQVVCDHHHHDWCGLLSVCHGRLCPQVWSCGKLVLKFA